MGLDFLLTASGASSASSAIAEAGLVAVSAILMLVACYYGGGLFLRYALTLPAIALERRGYEFADCKRDTSGGFAGLGSLAVLSALLFFIPNVIIAPLVLSAALAWSPYAVIAVLPLLCVSLWLSLFYGITLLTHLYAYFVEHREF
jgi:hypothetical protein